MQKTLISILDSFPFMIMYMDLEHTILYMNKKAEYRYYTQRGYDNLIGKNLLDCHGNSRANEIIINAVEDIKANGNEVLTGVNGYNEKVFLAPVYSENKKLVGYYARYEPSAQE